MLGLSNLASTVYLEKIGAIRSGTEGIMLSLEAPVASRDSSCIVTTLHQLINSGSIKTSDTQVNFYPLQSELKFV